MVKAKESKAKDVKASKKKDNTLIWGFGVLILIVVVVLLVRGCKTGDVSDKQTPTTPTGPQTTPEQQVPDTTVLKLDEVKCDPQAAIGYKSCSLLENGDIRFTILHQGSAALKGFQYYLYDASGNWLGEDAQMMPVEGGASADLTLPVSKFTAVEKVEIRPVMNVNGVDSICKNQRVLQIVDNC